MFNRPDYAKWTRKMAKDGYRKYSRQLIEDIWFALRNGDDLTESQHEHLLDCLKRTLKHDDANKGFYLKYERGKQKIDTTMRDIQAAIYMVSIDNLDLTYAKKLGKVVQQINKDFPETRIDKKAVEAAYTKHKDNALKAWQNR